MKATEFLINIWEPQAQDGFYFICSTKSRVDGNWKDHFFKWPIKKSQLKEFMEKFSTERYNLYFCPHPFRKPHRLIKYAMRTNLLWADLDLVNPADCIPAPHIAWKSSPNRYAALWRTVDFLEPEEAEKVNKALTYSVGADKGCWNITRVLRIPGTCNHKYKGSPKGKLLYFNTGKYGMEKFDTQPKVLNAIDVLNKVKKKIKPYTLNLLTAKHATVGKRSEVIWKLQRELFEQGLDKNEIFTLIKASVWNKFAGRTDEIKQLSRDLDKSGQYNTSESKAELAGYNQKEKDPNIKNVIKLSEVETEVVDWFWYPYIPLGKLTMLEGDPGLGKSWITMALAKAIANREKLPEQIRARGGRILLMSSEDGIEDTIKPRLESMGAECTKVYAYKTPVFITEEGIAEIEAEMMKIGPIMVIMDPLVSYMGSGVDLHKANETREIMDRLARLAAKFKCAIVTVRHLTKASKDKSIYRGIGSIDLTAAVRSALLVGQDPDEPNCRIICHIKSNLAPRGASLKYELVPGSQSPFRWKGTCDMNPEDLLKAPSGSSGTTELDTAKQWLKELLTDKPISAKEIKRDGEAKGINFKTIQKAKSELEISTVKLKNEWHWYVS
jgi:archaellum biogenesis ATPase FlaH